MNDVTAVIFAAGKGTRMLPLTETKPKPMQEVLGKNLLEWKIEALPESVKDIVLVIGYQGDQIKDFFGDVWKGKRITYVEQRELNGTAGALLAAKDSIMTPKFFVMMGDDLYAKEDIEALLGHDLAVCVMKVTNKEMGGEMIANPDGTFSGINEQRHFVESGLVNTGLYILDKRIFDHPPVPIGGSSTEFGLPHTLAKLAGLTPVRMVIAKKWMQITTPEDLVRAETEFFT